MRTYVGVTDNEWFRYLADLDQVDEVNFWQPGGSRLFRVLDRGGLFLFKLHSPLNSIVGGGFFAHSTLLPVSLAWEAFGDKNGAVSLPEMRQRVEKYRRQTPARFEDYQIGCILLEQPFFLPEGEWIPVPSDWKPNIVQGKTYDLTVEPGASLFRAIERRLTGQTARQRTLPLETSRFGQPTVIVPRLGQGSFRIMVTDAYGRRCAVTRERTLPALDAAHIVPYGSGGEHKISNGLLLRSDLHKLFDRGYVTVSSEHRFEVSRRIKEDFENGRDYYALHGHELNLPTNPIDRPERAFLERHNQEIYLG